MFGKGKRSMSSMDKFVMEQGRKAGNLKAVKAPANSKTPAGKLTPARKSLGKTSAGFKP